METGTATPAASCCYGVGVLSVLSRRVLTGGVCVGVRVCVWVPHTFF